MSAPTLAAEPALAARPAIPARPPSPASPASPAKQASPDIPTGRPSPTGRSNPTGRPSTDGRPGPTGPAGLAQLVRSVAARTELWTPRVRFEPGHRWYERLLQTTEHEVWLLTWLPSQGTEIHDHGGAGGAFTVVSGELQERAFAPAGQRTDPTPWALPAGSLRAFGPHHVHEVVNRGAVPAVSIHAYAPALTTMSYYRHGPDRLLELVRTDRVDEQGARR